VDTSRPPRVLVVGPIAGGSLETARSTARACQAAGAETRLLDFSPFAGGMDAFARAGVSPANRTRLRGELAKLLGEAVVATADEWRPDLMLALAQAPIGGSVCARLKAAGVTTAFWFVENHRVLRYWLQSAKHFDVFFAIQDEPFLTQLRDAGAPKAVYLPTACDPDRHAPAALTDAERRRFGAEISFAGAPYINRRRILLGLNDLAPRIWGEGWASTEVAHLAAEAGARFDLGEMIRIFSASNINLNIHAANHVEGLDPDPDYVNPRTFELASCGAFQLVDRRQPLATLFAEDEIVTFASIVELRRLIAHFRSRHEEREALAAKARARALAEHSFVHRVRQIFEHTLPPQLLPAARAAGPGERRSAGQAAGSSLADSIQRLERQSPKMTADEAMLRILQQIAGDGR
jgi:spore maturation protein CgeB